MRLSCDSPTSDIIRLLCYCCNAIDDEIESWCRSFFRFMEITVADVFAVSICQFLAIYSECRGIKYMKAAINDRIFNFFNLFSCTFCNDLVIEVCQFVCAFSKALAPVCINGCTVDDAFCCIFIIRFPVNGSTCQSCIRSCLNHRDIVTNTRNTCCLTC